MYEIGSITKTFTGLVLSQMVEQGKVQFDDPMRELLPPGLVPKPTGGEITLLSLATQHSGLPRLPDNIHPTNPADPYADYRPADLYAFLAKHTVAKPAQTDFLYSNLGFGLLGQALSNRAGVPYPVLLEQEITGPLD
jgi:serine-type D-Ala-D-Ala carboxypeptidase/endopeptidase